MINQGVLARVQADLFTQAPSGPKEKNPAHPTALGPAPSTKLIMGPTLQTYICSLSLALTPRGLYSGTSN